MDKREKETAIDLGDSFSEDDSEDEQLLGQQTTTTGSRRAMAAQPVAGQKKSGGVGRAIIRFIRYGPNPKEKERADCASDDDAMMPGKDFDMDMFMRPKRTARYILIADAFIMIIEFWQYLALMMAMSLRWPWPPSYLYGNMAAFLTNCDFFWEIYRVIAVPANISTYDRGFFVSSTLFPVMYQYVFSIYSAIFVAILLGLVGRVLYSRARLYITSALTNAKMFRVYLYLWQFLAIPLGLVYGRVIHCNLSKQVDVMNEYECRGGSHIAFIIVAAIVWALYFLLIPVLLFRKTESRLFTSNARKHKSIMKAREAEYVRGLDLSWLLGGYYIFSPFRVTHFPCSFFQCMRYRRVDRCCRRCNGIFTCFGISKLFTIHFRVTAVWMKFWVVLLFSLLFSIPSTQAVITTITFYTFALIILLFRPYRDNTFNLLAFLNFITLAAFATIGNIKALFPDPGQLSSVWATPEYTYMALIAVEIVYCILLFVWILTFFIRLFGLFGTKRLWVTMSTEGLKHLDENEKKFWKAIIRCRVLISKINFTPKLISPVHELSRQIKVIYAYLLEAKRINSDMQEVLADLLDEMLMLNAKLSQYSLFAETINETTRGTTAELLTVMPALARRMAQRDYDMGLVSKRNRRILLKLFTINAFLESTRKSRQGDLNKKSLDEIYPLPDRTQRAGLNYGSFSSDDSLLV